MTHPPTTISNGPDKGVVVPESALAASWPTSLLVLLLVAAVWAQCLGNPSVWRATGIGQTPVPFLDLYGSLAAGEAAQAHVDPYQLNPLDPYRRPHLYTRWWLVTGSLGLTREDTVWLAQTMLGLSLVTAVLLIRPRGIKQGLQMALVLCSPAVLMAVNRGNNDWVVFILGCAALGCLRSDRAIVRGLGFVLLAVCAELKYYPLAALIVLLGARTRRECWIGLGLFAVVLVIGWPALKPGLASAARYKPNPEGLLAFGAPNLFRELGFKSATACLVASGAVALWGCWLARERWRAPLVARPASSWDREFACGAALLAGCFFLSATYLYKMILAVWLLPWFWHEPAEGADQRRRQLGGWLLLAILWLEGAMAVPINLVLSARSPSAALRTLDATLLLTQLLTWVWVIGLVRWLVFYCVDRIRALLQAEPRVIAANSAPS